MRVGWITATGFAVGALLSKPAMAQMPVLRGGPMLDCSGLPCVSIEVKGGRHLKMLIDTGDVSSVIDAGVAKRMGLEVTPVLGKDGKEVPGYGRAVLPGVGVGDGALGDVKVLVMDLAEDMKKDVMPVADGSLAYTAFRDRVLEMDYPGKMVRVSEALTGGVARPVAGKCGVLTTPTFGKKGPPVVVATGFEVNGKAITAQIDSLYSGTMLIYPPAVEKLGLGEAAKGTKAEMFRYTDGGVEMVNGGAALEGFLGRGLGDKTPVYFATPAVHLPDGMFDGTVGHGLLKGSVVVMDFMGMRVWLR